LRQALQDAVEFALKIGYRPATTMFNLACVHARLGDRNTAFDWLSRAHTAGFKVEQACWDEDLVSLREDPRFSAYAKKCEKEEK